MSTGGSNGSRGSVPREEVETELEGAEDPSQTTDGFNETNNPTLWPEDYLPIDYVEGFVANEGFGEAMFWEPWEHELAWNKGGETFYNGEQVAEEEEEDEDEEEEIFPRRLSSFSRRDSKLTEKARHTLTQELRRRSLFVHSSPTHFPDINRVRKSAFGSIFLRTTAHVAEDLALLKTVVDSSFSMLQSLLLSFEKIISSPITNADRRQTTVAFKESLLKALEHHGISKTFSDGSVHWNVYPISQNFLFSFQIGDHLHQTRLLSRLEDRILTGPVQKLKLPYAWPTDSVWTGYWDALGMAGVGTYNMPHGVSYNGKMQSGRFHDDDAMLTYPNQFKAVHCVFEKGKLQSCQFQFPDMLMHKKENWEYCKFPDRRFWSEVRKGLKPAKIAQKTEHDPARNIPQGCYDTSDGFFDPVSLMLIGQNGELLRVPVCEEMSWIKRFCRKGFTQNADFRPDLFENWFKNDQEIIRSILHQQANFRTGKISYSELQQFYADLELLPPWSKYKKRKASSEIAMETDLGFTSSRKTLTKTEDLRKFQGHKIPSEIIAALKMDKNQPMSILSTSSSKILKNFPKSNDESQTMNKSSKIGFMFSKTDSLSSSGSEERSLTTPARIIPEAFMKYQPILQPPFQSSTHPKTPSESRRKCPSLVSYNSEDFLMPESGGPVMPAWEKKELQKYMKELIMGVVTDILVKERERLRQRLKWAKKPRKEASKERETSKKSHCLSVLQELFESIPDRDEYCEENPAKAWDLRELAQDKYEVLKYWGNRIFTLDFSEQDFDVDLQ